MLDHLLAFTLLVVLPGRALWRRRVRSAYRSKVIRYRTSIGVVSALLLLLASDWLATRRTVQSLGLGIPTTTAAAVGLVVATILLIALHVVAHRGSTSHHSSRARTVRASLPDTPGEVRLFVLASVMAGCGWEILYRGFLLYYLQLHMGQLAAIAVATIAYGAAHEIRSRGQIIGSFMASFAFAMGYAVTGNLWWLMLLHAGLPLLGLHVRATAEAASP